MDIYINTRGVGLAEAFEQKCRDDYGLPADRRCDANEAEEPFVASVEKPRTPLVVGIVQAPKSTPAYVS